MTRCLGESLDAIFVDVGAKFLSNLRVLWMATARIEGKMESSTDSYEYRLLYIRMVVSTIWTT